MLDGIMQDTMKRWLLDPAVGKIAVVVVLLAVVYLAVRLLRRTVSRHVQDADTRYKARKLVSFLGYLTVFLVLATALSDRLSGLTVAFGVTGAGIAFALQEVIASVAGWVAISFGGFYRTGDRVQVGGIKGDVIDIAVLRTTLMEVGQWVNGDLYNGRIVRIANSFVFKEPVFNYSGDFPFLWDEITFPVRYGSDWKFTRDMLQRVVTEIVGDYAIQSKDAWKDVVRKYRIEEARIDPMITIRADENWIEYTIRYIVDYRKRRATKDLLYSRILEEVDKAGDRVGIATAGFELLSIPRLEVRLRETAPGAGEGPVTARE
jgi:small-conductance mechanosensitive channel